MTLQKLRIAPRLALAFGIAAAMILGIAVYAGTYALVVFDGRDAATSRAARDLAYTLYAIGILASGVMVAIAWIVTRSVTGPIGKAISATRAAATGDFTVRAAVEGHDESAELLAALRTMSENLAGVVSRARSGTEAIARASAEVATGAQHLAARTEDEASTLAEAAATLEQFTAAVRQNAEHAGNASRLAEETSKIARDGNQVVGRVVSTMDQIAASSKRIADIVSVIDGIAFQTNILALNAAVEAARAGEEGRGFAVVASEVRSLAQRSAASAREIRDLIGDSLGKVDVGAREARAAGEAMDDILTSINIVSEVVSQIADAGREQSAGVGQINIAVAKLDSVTQANASLAGETTAAAHRMRDESARLAGTLSQFRVAGDTAGAAPALAPEAEALPLPRPARRKAVTHRPAASRPDSGEEWAEF